MDAETQNYTVTIPDTSGNSQTVRITGSSSLNDDQIVVQAYEHLQNEIKAKRIKKRGNERYILQNATVTRG